MADIEPGKQWRWEIAERPVAVDLAYDVVDRLHADAVQALGAVPRRGLEVGGILLGTVREGERATIEITDYESVACDYIEGPSYVLHELDGHRFVSALARLRADAARRMTPVGFYRTHTREPFAITEDDVRLMDELFPGACDVMLLIRPSMLGACAAAFLVRQDGRLETGPIGQTFPFRRRDLGGGSGPVRHHNEPTHREAAEPAAPAAVDDSEVRPPDHTPDYVAPPAPPTKRSHRIAVAIFAVAMITFAAAAGYVAGTSSTPSRAEAQENPYALGVRAERNGGNIVLRWNQDARAVRTAWKGVLTVTTRSDTRTVPLDAQQLRNGTVLYTPAEPGMRFRLEIYLSEQRSLSEMITWRPETR